MFLRLCFLVFPSILLAYKGPRHYLLLSKVFKFYICLLFYKHSFICLFIFYYLGQAIKSYVHGNNKITLYSNTAESVAPNGIKVTLHGRDLWAKFHKSTTEMIITKAGRSVMTLQDGLRVWGGFAYF